MNLQSFHLVQRISHFQKLGCNTTALYLISVYKSQSTRINAIQIVGLVVEVSTSGHLVRLTLYHLIYICVDT